MNLADFALFANQWLNSDCSWPDWCQGADTDQSGTVGLEDLQYCMGFWLIDFQSELGADVIMCLDSVAHYRKDYDYIKKRTELGIKARRIAGQGSLWDIKHKFLDEKGQVLGVAATQPVNTCPGRKTSSIHRSAGQPR